MDRKQQNIQLCRTSTGGSTICGCHVCEAKGVQMIDSDSNVSRFRLCSPDSYYLSKIKCNSIQEHSATRGYMTTDYKQMDWTDIYNRHFASPIDLYHALHNLMEMIDDGLKGNILQSAGHIERYNRYLCCLTQERDSHNCLKYNTAYLTADMKFFKKISLDQCFTVTVMFFIYVFLEYLVKHAIIVSCVGLYAVCFEIIATRI